MDLKHYLSLFNQARGAIVHAGAHYAQERFSYRDMGLQPVIWIEALESIAEVARHHLADFNKNYVRVGLLSDQRGQNRTFFISSNSAASSSMLPMANHKKLFIDVRDTEHISLTTTTLDYILDEFDLEDISLMVLDLQGCELQALQGGQKSLKKTWFIMVEVALHSVYENQPLFTEVVDFMNLHDFSLIDYEMNPEVGYGNALFLRKRCCDLSKIRVIETEEIMLLQNEYRLPLFVFVKRALIVAWQAIRLRAMRLLQ